MATPDSSHTPLAATDASPNRAFPTLTAAQMARMAAHGRGRWAGRRRSFVEVGDAAVPLCVVVSGEVHGLRPTDDGEEADRDPSGRTVYRGSQHDRGRRAIGTAACPGAWRSHRSRREELLALVQTDAELSEILMRAFILRRRRTGGARPRRRRRDCSMHYGGTCA